MSNPHDFPDPIVQEHRRAWPSLVWLAPLIALVLSVGIAWQSYMSKGPLIEVVLENAAGIETGKTPLKHKQVQVGVVEDLGFTPGLQNVLVKIRVDKDIAPYFDTSAQFWVVSPQVTTRGITGLDTVLSGSYLEVSWDGLKGEQPKRFTALKNIPLSYPGKMGTRIQLRANDGGSMVVGAPVLYKRIEVGKVEAKELSDDGELVDFSIFINAPHDKLLTTATRFWQMSGVAVEVGADGAKLKVDSLASLLQGGISFDTISTGGQAVGPEQSFVLYSSETDARRSIFTDSPGEQLHLSVEFESSVRGLKIGAPVEYRGLRVGEVTDVKAKVTDQDDEREITLIVTFVLQPARLGIKPDNEEALYYLKRAVARGLRAKLSNASLLTGALYVELVEQPDADVALLDDMAKPYPRIPSVPSDFDDITASAEGVLNRLNALPIEDMLYSATDLIKNLNALVTSEGVTNTPDQVSALLTDARSLVSDPELSAAVKSLSATLKSAQSMMGQMEENGTAEALTNALKGAQTAALSISTAAQGAPAIIERLNAIAENVEALPLEELVATANSLLVDVDAIVNAEGVKDIPANLNDSLMSLRLLLGDLRDANAAKNLSAALQAARDGATAFSTAVQGAPALIQRLNALADKAGALPLENLVASSIRLVQDADRIAAAPGAAEMPGALTAALDEIRYVIADLRQQGTIQNLNGTMTSFNQASLSFTDLSNDLAVVLPKISKIAENADSVLSSFDVGSELNYEAVTALRELRDAARAITALAATVERRPNSLLLGK